MVDEASATNVTNNLIYESRMVQGGNNNLLLVSLIYVQVITFILDAYLKLDMEMVRLWFPTAILFVMVFIGYVIDNVKTQ